jgi:hypothetical protein
MSLTVVLDIVIGLSFIYFLLSLFCSWVNEALASGLNKRGKFLFDGLREMLQDPAKITSFVKHPLIESLDKVRQSSGLTRAQVDADPTHAVRLEVFPSYLPPKTVATVLLDIVAPAGGANRFADARRQIDSLADPKLKKALQAIADRADNDIEALRKGVEDWYSNTMDRVSGWYKSHSQHWLMVFGLLLAVSLNVDTLRITRELWENPAARSELVRAATEMVQATGDKDVKAQLAAIKAAPTAEERAKLQEKLNLQVGSAAEAAQRAAIPLGWSRKQIEEIRNWTVFDFAAKVAGLLVTAAAIALGAPFWFDLINKMIDVRSSGRKPEARQ